jgi:uncharacterized membrane protein
MVMDMIGKWAFVIGVILAIAVGLLGQMNTAVIVILMLLGLVIGFLNVTGKEAAQFLVAGVSIIIAGSLGTGAFVGVNNSVTATLVNIFGAISVLVVPAVIIVAIREVFVLAKEK